MPGVCRRGYGEEQRTRGRRGQHRSIVITDASVGCESLEESFRPEGSKEAIKGGPPCRLKKNLRYTIGLAVYINIATVVDDLIDRVMVDPRLNSNPRVDEAHHRVSPAGFKYYVPEMVCWAAGGPQKYSGRTMGDSHRHLMITEEECSGGLIQ